MQRRLARISGIALLAGAILLALTICGVQLSTDQWLLPQDASSLSYPALLAHFKALFDDGISYPRWLEEAGKGYGLPAFLFVPPGYFYFTLPLTWLDLPDGLDIKLGNLLCTLMAVCGYFSIARLLGNRISTGIALTLLATLNTLWFHAAFDNIASSQRLALSIAIWGIYFLLRLGLLMEGGKAFLGTWLLLSASGAATIYAHPQTAAPLGLLAVAIALGQWLTMDRPHRHGYSVSVLASAILAVLLAAPYWYHAYDLLPYVELRNLPESGGKAFDIINAAWPGFILWHWTTPDAPSLASPALLIELAFYFTILACIYKLRRVAGVFPVVLLYIVAVILMLPASRPAWEGLLPLRYLNDPRLLQPVTHLIEFILLCGTASYLFAGGRGQRFMIYGMGLCAAALGALCLVAYHPFQAPHLLPLLPPVKTGAYAPMVSALPALEPLTPRSAYGTGTRRQPSDPLFTLLPESGNALNILEQHGGIPAMATLSVNRTSESPLWLQFNQYYFPGWKLHVKPAGLQEDAYSSIRVRINGAGLMQLGFMEKGIYHIRAAYEGPPNWHIRNAVITFLTLWLLVCYVLSYRDYRRHDPASGAT